MENIRLVTEHNEELILSSKAVLSKNSKGRKVFEEPCDLRTEFQRDRDRIIHSKSFRRLKHKTQVFLSPESDHYRTRLTHTLEVAQIARTVSRALRLNEDLTEAIALGHDLGHTPFGHAGERALDELVDGGFRHYEQSVRVCELLEKDFHGLNLTYEVLDGIKRHTTGAEPITLEGSVVRIADKIAYINHDIDDAIRANVILEEDIPSDIREYLGKNKTQRIDNLVHNLVDNSTEKISFSEECLLYFNKLHDFLFQNVYFNPKAKSEESKVAGVIEGIYNYILHHPDKLPCEYTVIVKRDGFERAIADYIASMTDHYAVSIYQSYFIPKFWELHI